LSFIGTREISERVSENIHFDFVAGKNYTSEGGGTQMKGRFRGGTAATRGVGSSFRAKRGIALQQKPKKDSSLRRLGMTEDLLEGFELHSPEKIRAAIAAGADVKAPIHGKRPIEWLMEMYLRSGRFVECVRVMLEVGATLDDSMLEAILLDDDMQLRKLLQQVPHSRRRKFHLECAYTPLHGVSPLHVCAEYNSVKCARALLEAGADVNARAEFDGDGLGGQTAVFHAVNSNGNYCRPVMELLVEAGADLDVRLKGLVWGMGFAWETTIFDVTPISYAQCGLYFQFHRKEQNVYGNIAYLWRNRFGSEIKVRNVPNKYLEDARVFPPRM
jgi:hypothetical protein